ncbi:MAG: fasciclin domain-containing protein [Flavobacteriales bacterium]|nr:fasciclin domain-containing protein [Flavobacteriales bacterium]
MDRKTLSVWIVFSCLITLVSCMEEGSVDPGTENQKAPEKETVDRSKLKDTHQNAVKPTKKVPNLTSNYRYVISADELSIFGSLVKRSSVAKTLHNTKNTLFAPTNDALQNRSAEFNSWLENNDLTSIDAYVKKYIIIDNYNFKELMENEETMVALSGDQITIKDKEVIEVNGVKTDGEFVTTGSGFVYYLEDELK